MQRLLQAHQPLGFLLRHPGSGNTRPQLDNLCYILLGHLCGKAAGVNLFQLVIDLCKRCVDLGKRFIVDLLCAFKHIRHVFVDERSAFLAVAGI